MKWSKPQQTIQNPGREASSSETIVIAEQIAKYATNSGNFSHSPTYGTLPGEISRTPNCRWGFAPQIATGVLSFWLILFPIQYFLLFFYKYIIAIRLYTITASRKCCLWIRNITNTNENKCWFYSQFLVSSSEVCCMKESYYSLLLFPNICSNHKRFLEVKWTCFFYNIYVEPRQPESGGCKVTMRLSLGLRHSRKFFY